jgi:xylulose-5-phosphate/fructose-6-phosphate phosphoketolase
LEGYYSEIYPDCSQDAAGMLRLFRQFSFPGGIGSHCTPETPGSIHEGGELGYSLSHAYGAAFDNPDLIVACAVGDGEAETGPLATSWHSNKFLNPIRDGAVLPVLHLNGYKIANPTILARIPRAELEHLFLGLGYTPWRAAILTPCIRPWPQPSSTASWRFARCKLRRAAPAALSVRRGRCSCCARRKVGPDPKP